MSCRFQTNQNSTHELRAINSLVKSVSSSTLGNAGLATTTGQLSGVKRATKRILLPDDQDDDSVSAPRMLCTDTMSRKIQGIVMDRNKFTEAAI